MTRARGAKLTIDAERELCLEFLKSDPEDNLFDVDFDISKAEASENGDVHIEGYLNSPNVDDDLDGDVVDAKAFERELKHFMRHPVIRREHKHPIGTVLKVEFRPEGPWFEGVVTHDAPNEKTRDMIQRKVLRGISARFTAKPTPEDVELLPKGKGRMRVKNARLVEVTVTDVPRNSGGHFKMKEPTRAAFQKSLSASSDVQPKSGGNLMKFEELIARLLNDAGHKCNSEDQLSIMKALGDAISVGKNAAGLLLIAKALGKPDNSTPEQLVEALKTATSNDNTIAKSLYDDVVKKKAETDVELLLLKNSDRITPANKEFAKSLAQTDSKMFEQWLTTQAPIPGKLPGDNSDAGNRSTSGGGAGNGELTTFDIDVAKAFGAITDQVELKKIINMKPHEVMSSLLKQPVSETAHDKVHRQMYHQQWDAVTAPAA